MEAVLACGEGEAAVGHANAVVDLESVAACLERVIATVDIEFVLAHHTVTAGGGDRQLACAVEVQGILGKQYRINVALVNGGEGAAVAQAVFTLEKQGNGARLLHIEGGGAFAVDVGIGK